MAREKALVLVPLLAMMAGLSYHRVAHAQATSTPTQQTASPARFQNGGNAAQIPATFIGHRVFLPVRVNGSQPSLFELDSTARVSSIDPGRASELNLTTETPAASAGSSAGPFIHDAVLELPGVDVPLATLSVMGSADFGTIVGRPYEGTLGNDFLTRVVVEIDYGQQAVRLYDPSAFHYAGKGTSLPLSFAGVTPEIHAKFSELEGRSGDGEFLVNTALDASVVFSSHFAEAHRLFSSHMTSVQTADPELDNGETISLARLDSFQMGAYDAAGAIAAFSRTDQASGGDPRIAGTVGGGMLRRFVVVFDLAHQQLIFEPGSFFRSYDEEDKSGMTLAAKGPGLKRFEVVQVQPDSPAAKAGIQKGDVIAGINDEPAADMTLDSVRQLFCQVARKYDLLIERDEKTIEVSLLMRRRI